MEKEQRNEKAELGGQIKQKEPTMSPMIPLVKDAYGGGLYAQEEVQGNQLPKQPASATQSADGPAEATIEPKHQPPPSTGDRDLDITGQSYIQ